MDNLSPRPSSSSARENRPQSRSTAAFFRHKRIFFGLAIASCFGVVTAFAVAPARHDQLPSALETVIERLNPPELSVIPGNGAGFLREETVARGDTLAQLFSRLGISDQAAFNFIRSDATAKQIAHQLRPGKQITARTTEDGELLALHSPVNGKDALIVVRRTDSGFQADEEAIAFETRTEVRAGEIRYSLFGATDALGIPDNVATQMAEIFGGDIDFHRDLRKGDRFSLIYEVLYQRGQPVRGGRILAAEFTNNQKTYQAYWHGSSKPGGYYTADGKNLRKAFLRSPLEFSRITSGFSNGRFHPILKTWRAHKGIDYGAPTGTRVRSVADGTIEFIGRQNGYGNLIIVRHHGVYSTAYGHLNGFAPGMRKGAAVSQGQLIGYVGQTGMATGPHLHYEFRVKNRQVNPLAVVMPAAPALSSAEIAAFKARTEPWRAHLQMVNQVQTTQIAAR